MTTKTDTENETGESNGESDLPPAAPESNHHRTPHNGHGVIVEFDGVVGHMDMNEFFMDYEYHPSGNVVTLYSKNAAYDIPTDRIKYIWHTGCGGCIPADRWD